MNRREHRRLPPGKPTEYEDNSCLITVHAKQQRVDDIHYIYCEFRQELLGGQAISQRWNANDQRDSILNISVQLFIEFKENATSDRRGRK